MKGLRTIWLASLLVVFVLVASAAPAMAGVAGLKARLNAGPGFAASGMAQFADARLQVDVEDGPVGAVLDVCVAGKLVGRMSLNSKGDNKATFKPAVARAGQLVQVRMKARTGGCTGAVVASGRLNLR